MSLRIVIRRRYRGPVDSGNGGYVCGVLAGFVAGEAEVTLRLPPPLERPLDVEGDGERILLLDGDALVAEAVPSHVELVPPAPVSWEEALDATTRYLGFHEHPFPECFTCGPGRAERDSLRIFPGSVAGRPDTVAAPWVAHEVDPAVLWAAIDCPGAFAVGVIGRGETVLGRMAARIDRIPAEGERCISAGFALGEDGRKLYAGTALFAETGEVLALAKQTWIVPRG